MSFVLSFNPVWSFVDLTGLQLDDTYYAFFLQNTLPYLPQTVYQDPLGNNPWPTPLQLLANGTLPTNLFFDNTLIYRIEIRQGNDQNAPLIYLIENYIPNGSGVTPIQSITESTENVISNSQFSIVNFTSPLVLSSAGTYNIAPGWQLITTGSGSVTLSQIAIAASSNTVTNPPYALQITNAGFTQVTLQQTFSGNGGLWTREAVALSLTASANNPIMLSAQLLYSDNSQVSILNTTLGTAFQQYPAATTVLPATNPNVPPNTSTALQILWTGSAEVTITSIQLVGQDTPLAIDYQQVPLERQVDYLFHYYNNFLQFKPLPSFLVGWDFRLNPAQILGYSVATINTGNQASAYCWDQTIFFQTVTSAMSFAQDPNTLGLQATAALASSFGYVQYMEEATARKLLDGQQAIQLSGFCSSGQGTIKGTVSLWYTTQTTLPNLNSNFSPIAAIAAGGVPTVGVGGNYGTWTQVTCGGLPASQPFTLTPTEQAISFTGFDSSQTSAATTATYVAIVVAFDTLAQSNTLTLNYVSLVQGSIATPPAPKTYGETLRECQRFYEKSYQPQVVAGTATTNGIIQSPVPILFTGVAFTPTPVSQNSLYLQSFYLRFKQEKRYGTSGPMITFYNPLASNTPNIIYVTMLRNNSTVSVLGGLGSNPSSINISNWNMFLTASGFPTPSTSGVYFVCNNTSTLIMRTSSSGGVPGDEGALIFHYVVDARLGIVT
jgi:hypothetical protein